MFYTRSKKIHFVALVYKICVIAFATILNMEYA